MNEESLDIVEQLMLLVAESIDLHPETSPARALLERAERDLRQARQRCLNKSGYYKVAVVGLGNVGKSTLINALLGTPVAAVSNGPCTASIVEFEYGKAFKIEATSDSLIAEVMNFSCVDLLREKLFQLTAHASNESQAWNKLVVTVPCDILANGLVLVDTPGFGAAGEVGVKDNQIFTQFLNEDAAQIFWVVTADGGIGSREQGVYTSMLAERCDDLIVTNSEDYTPAERSRWEQLYRPRLSLRTRIHFVSGKEANEALSMNDLTRWERSGVQDLVNQAHSRFSLKNVLI